jgi:hypothetical protein
MTMAAIGRMKFCGSPDHSLSRRAFLGGAAAATAAFAGGMGAIRALAEPALTGELKRQQKRVILLWLAGGASQLETWDPKPGRPTGGPFSDISTSVPGVRISELMPKMAQRLDQHTAIIRSLNTRDGDHGGASILMMRGRKDEANLRYPDLGAMVAREFGRIDSEVPDYVSIYSETEGRNFSRLTPAFLGARFAPIELTEKMGLEDVSRLESISDLDHIHRAELRDMWSKRFARGRENPIVGSHNMAYQRVRGLMASDKLFDISGEPQSIRDQYGPTQFGEQALIARRLVEAGVPFVRVARAWWDSHGQNFETHQELVPELDHVMSALLDDLQDRGLLEHTLVITLAEFGRTPNINASLGRDHFASAWSCTLSGCGVNPGAVYGKTDADGQRVADGEVNAGDVFATIFSALGLDPDKEYHVGARPIPLVNPGHRAIKDVLA